MIAQATFTQRHSSGNVGRFPYDRMPTLKIFAVIQKKRAMVTIDTPIVVRTWDIGGSATSVRMNIVIGQNTGASEKPTARPESGLVISPASRNHGSIMIM